MGSKQHPSNTIKDARSFPEAIQRVYQAINWERRDARALDPDGSIGITKSLDDYLDQARKAEAIHAHAVIAAERTAAEEMRAAGLDEFAEALESGDYSGLAI